MRIAIGAAKGGVGKTTTTVHLGLLLARRGPTVLIDGDRQHSLTTWWREAERQGEAWPESLTLEPWPSRGGLTVPPMAHVVVDTGPGDLERLSEAVGEADTVIVPCGARGADVAQLGVVMSAIEKGSADRELVYGALMTFVRLGTRNARRAPASVDADEVARFETVVPLREDEVDAFGTVPTRHGAYVDLMAELDTLHGEDEG